MKCAKQEKRVSKGEEEAGNVNTGKVGATPNQARISHFLPNNNDFVIGRGMISDIFFLNNEDYFNRLS